MGLDDRKFKILQAIIDDYIMTAIPVGSRTISKKFDMGLSSATIRNEMSDLEELGYLDQPHVSAGRIPSAKAYRFYVNRLLQEGAIGSDAQADVESHFVGRVHQMEDVVDHAARVISALTHYTAVVLPPAAPQPRIRTIQLVPVSSGEALVVIVTDSGIIRDSVIHVSDQLDSDALYAISRSLTGELAGMTLAQASARMPVISARIQEHAQVFSEFGDLLEHSGTKPGHVGIGGPSNILTYPEYSDVEKARNFLSLIETREKLASIIGRQGEMSFTVRIGPENDIPEMADLSVVTMGYSANGQQGTIGVIGPTRMQYSRVMSIMNVMGRQLTDLFSGKDPEGCEPADKTK